MTDPVGRKCRVILFGGAGIQADGAPLGGRATYRHPLAIIALLIGNGGRPLTRDKLIGLLWPERDTDAARNLLKVNVHELRRELGDAAIRSTSDQLSADLDVVSCDVAEFVAAIENGNDLTAVELYRGPFLDGFFIKDAAAFDQWVEGERTRLADMYGAALERLAAAAEASRDVATAVRWRRAHAAHDPYREDVARRLVESLAAAGDRTGAIQAAESFVERRRRDFGVSDDDAIVVLARRLASGNGAGGAGGTAAGRTPAPEVAADSVPAVGDARPAEPALDRVPVRTGRRMRWTVAAVSTAVVLLALSRPVLRAVSSAAPAPTTSTSRLAVAPFRVVGVDSSYGDAFADLVSARFTGEGSAKAIDSGATSRAWTTGSVHDAPALGVALRGARSLGATQLVMGDVVGAHDSVTVTARLYSAADGALLASARADASAGERMARVADRVAIELIARAAGEPGDRVEDLVGRPPAAARAYVAGELAYREARYAAAESLYARSLGVDSTFGAAGLGLALANSWQPIDEHYGVGRDAAIRNRATMSARDRAFVDAFFGPDPALGPPRPAPVYLTAWEDIAEKWPDGTEALYQLGDRYYHFGGLSGLADPGERARTAFRRALALDSNFVAPLHHLVELYAARRELGALRATGARYFAANPSTDRDRSAIGWEMAMALGDSAWVRRIRANFDAMPAGELTRIGWVTDANGWPRDDAVAAATIADRKATTSSEHEKALISLFTLRLNAGQTRQARAAASAIGAIYPDHPVGALWDLYAALFGDGDTALATDAAARLGAFAREPLAGDHVLRDQHHQAACLLAYRDAVRGNAGAARAALDRLAVDLRREENGFARRNAHVCLAMLRATVAVRARASDAALLVAQLDTDLLRERVPPHAILEAGTIAAARLHAQLGDTAAALVAARRREHLTGDALFLSTELRDEAVYAAAMHDSAGAARALAHLRALRGNGG